MSDTTALGTAVKGWTPAPEHPGLLTRFLIRAAVLVLAGFLLTGCSFVGPRLEPTPLPFPPRPSLEFQETGVACLNEQDADKLAKWLDQLSAFQHAWDRLRKR